ncbi:cyclase [Auraticoccus sp. F435]|uniref:Cyclase n=1 Tax=Auraticoccus cholistanensis TaxID=2656650 RepID=A0A6A9UX96_9ACTN|nr:SRPBCC family protein [Auraticoccus cholistanensis]MVA77341.1 cyclase [Auraticoccus cholistanensis]
MAERTRASAVIEAPPEQVMAVIADLTAYPEWVDSMAAVEVLTTSADGRPDLVRMSLRHPLISESYTVRYSWAEDEVSWHLVEGEKLTAMDGSYQLRPRGAGTEVTYSLSVDLTLPLLGMLRRKAEKTIVDGALKGLGRRVASKSGS